MLLERRVIANTIEYTKNPPGKELECLNNAMSSFPLFQLSGNLSVILKAKPWESSRLRFKPAGSPSKARGRLTTPPLQMGKNGRGKYNQLVVSTPSLEVRCKI